jgi:hypothetical protein
VTVRPEPVEGCLERFDKLTANGLIFGQHALLSNNSNLLMCPFLAPGIKNNDLKQKLCLEGESWERK